MQPDFYGKIVGFGENDVSVGGNHPEQIVMARSGRFVWNSKGNHEDPGLE